MSDPLKALIAVAGLVLVTMMLLETSVMCVVQAPSGVPMWRCR